MSQEMLHDRCVSIAALIVSVAKIEHVSVQDVANEIMNVMNS